MGERPAQPALNVRSLTLSGRGLARWVAGGRGLTLSGRGLTRWVARGRGLTLTGVASVTATAYYM